MDERPPHTMRRRILAQGLGLAGACVLGITIDAGNTAAAKSPKAALLYQDHPDEGHRCSDCKFFNAAGNDAPTGICALVEGTIDRNGWCMAFLAQNVTRRFPGAARRAGESAGPLPWAKCRHRRYCSAPSSAV